MTLASWCFYQVYASNCIVKRLLVKVRSSVVLKFSFCFFEALCHGLTLVKHCCAVGIMHQFDHPNIIKLIGVCPSSPMSIIMELAEFGEVCFIFTSYICQQLDSCSSCHQ